MITAEKQQSMNLPLPRPKLVSICGWCPDARSVAARLEAKGFEVSHGICEACSDRVFGSYLRRAAQ